MSVRMAASPVIIGLIVKYVGVLGTQKLNCWLLRFKMARSILLEVAECPKIVF